MPTEIQLQRLAAMANMLPGEEWLPVPDYERTYLVSSLGRMFSVPRARTPGGIMRRRFDDDGYVRVQLVQDGKQRTRRVHVLVMSAFHGATPDGLEIRHMDGDPTNARLSNLNFGTHSENGFDNVRHGGNSQALKTHCPRDHPYSEANTRLYRGRRFCRACQRVRYWEAKANA